jgi:hypothetical protein
MTFDPSINLGHLVTIVMILVGIIIAWTKFGGRLDMIEYRVTSIEKTLLLLGETLKSIAETEKKMAVMDGRQLAMEGSYTSLAQAVEGLRKGEGYIQSRRANIDGNYDR